MYTVKPSNRNSIRIDEKNFEIQKDFEILRLLKTAGMHLTLKCFFTCMDNFQAVS